MLRISCALYEAIHQLRQSTSGVTAIEYGLIAGAISVVIILAVTQIGTNINLRFQAISTALAPAAAPGP
jgi:pilus assembly protein Flp/PilA